MFDCLTRENRVSQEKCAALVFAGEAAVRKSELRESLDLLKACGQVVDLRDSQRAASQLLTIAS